MATYQHLASRNFVKTYLHNPADATTAAYIAWVPMQQAFLAQAMLVSGTGVLTFKIFAATDSSGAGATVVKAHAAPTDADAAGDLLQLEVSAEEVLGALAHASHVAVEMDCDHADDIIAVTYVLTGGRAYIDQSAGAIS